MDVIIQNFLNEFTDNIGYPNLSLSEQFELFTNFCVINKEYDSVSFEEKDSNTGKATQGIDGIGIIVNNKLCSTQKEIEELIELNRTLNVNFILIQAKTSPKFEGSQIESFFRWRKSFFAQDMDLFVTYSQDLEKLKYIKNVSANYRMTFGRQKKELTYLLGENSRSKECKKKHKIYHSYI